MEESRQALKRQQQDEWEQQILALAGQSEQRLDTGSEQHLKEEQKEEQEEKKEGLPQCRSHKFEAKLQIL